MTTESSAPTQNPESTKSRRYSRKSAGRSAWMKQLHEQNRAGQGGRKIDHGQRALDRRLQEGLNPDSAMAQFHTERRNAYADALGGLQGLDQFQLGLLDRLADNDVARSVLVGSRSKWRSSTMTRILRDLDYFGKNGLAYLQFLKALREAMQRSQKQDTEIVIKRWPDPSPAPENGRDGDQHDGHDGGKQNGE